jgi:hypothetical protein
LRGKGTRNSPNRVLYGGDSPGEGEPVVGVRTDGQSGRWLGRELRGAVPELGDGWAGPGSGRRELAPARCLPVGRATTES